MCSTTTNISCPLCCHPNFSSVDSLRSSLVNVTNRPLICPICNDILLGLDKLTIHLFSHTLVEECVNEKLSRFIEETVRCASTNDPQSTATTTTFVKTETNCNNEIRNNWCQNWPNQVVSPIIDQQSNFFETALQHEPPQNDPQCDICGFSFRTKELQIMHMKLVHEIDVDEITDNCTINKSEDIAGPNKSKFQCHLCSKMFKMKGSLRVHLRVVHLFGIPPSSNCTSGRIFNNFKFNLIKEQKPSNESVEQDLSIDNKLSLKETREKEDTNNFLTDNIETDLKSPSADDLAEVDKVQISQNKQQTNNNANVNEPKLWDCEICAKSFTTKYFLKKHKRLHTGEMPYTCEICGKTFTFQQSYHKHLLYHNDDKPHICSQCGRAFKELSTLHNHERIHSGEKPFKCETCDKCFRQRVSYLVHRRIHTGAMPYKCTACDKSFRYKVSQRTHKCLAQPPGTVVRQTGELLQRLMLQNSLFTNQSLVAEQNEEAGDSQDLLVKSLPEEYLNQTLDEIVEESCNKLGIGENGTIYYETSDNLRHNPIKDVRVASPSEKFQNLCLYSPVDVYPACTTSLDTINEASFKQLVYGTSTIVEDHLNT